MKNVSSQLLHTERQPHPHPGQASLSAPQEFSPVQEHRTHAAWQEAEEGEQPVPPGFGGAGGKGREPQDSQPAVEHCSPVLIHSWKHGGRQMLG